MDYQAAGLVVISGLLAVGGFLIKRWVEDSNNQLRQHVSDCNDRNKEVKQALSTMSDRIGETAINLAGLEGTINEALKRPRAQRSRRR